MPMNNAARARIFCTISIRSRIVLTYSRRYPAESSIPPHISSEVRFQLVMPDLGAEELTLLVA